MDSIDDIYLNARELTDAAERARYLDEACGIDAGLRERVETMLRDAEGAEAFFGPMESQPPAWTGAQGAGEGPGTIIGPYKLLEKLGEGGCGVVYMAEQTQPVRRRVALKLLKLGMDTRSVIARFEAEGQALALMDHPNIARVFDAGASSAGRPYIVMELVRGIRITEYCDQGHLPTRERLRLFLDVSQAVQHAHQKGIIHRDLKPSNILVAVIDGQPVLKVIDFGIAKAIEQKLTDKTLFTEFRALVGTPAYMSPEQAGLGASDADTRSDVYSLGVLLYELLTGRTPLETQDLLPGRIDEMRRLIREREPLRPSTRLKTLRPGDLTMTAIQRAIEPPKLIHQVRGDLDWIVMKCLEKDRSRRYQTVNALARDLARHLNHEPVQARPPSASYRLRKMVRRHRLAFTAGAAVLAALLAGLGVSIALLVRARAAEQARIEELWRSYLATARVSRRSGVPGQRLETLGVISNAARIRPSPELRNEAIAALALPDLGPPRYGSDTPWVTNHPQELYVAFDHELRRVALVAQDSSIYVRNVEDNTEWLHLPALAAGEEVSARLLFSPDDQFLAARYCSGAIRCWQLAPLRLCVAARHDASLAYALGFAADSRSLLAGVAGRGLEIYPLTPARSADADEPPRSRPETIFPLDLRPEKFVLDPTATWLAVTDETNVQVWRWRQHRLISGFAQPNRAYELAWHEDGSHLFIGTVGGVDVRQNPFTERRELRGHVAVAQVLSLHPRGDLLATVAWEGASKLWDMTATAPLLTTDQGLALQFSRDGRQLGFRHPTHRWGVWPMLASRVFRSFGVVGSRAAGAVDFAPAGDALIWTDDFGLWWADLQDGQYSCLKIPGLAQARFAADGSAVLLAGADGLRRWSLRPEPGSGPSYPRFDGEPQRVGTNRFGLSWPMRIPSDRRWIVAAEGRSPGTQNRLLIVDERGPLERVLRCPGPGVGYYTALSPDARWLAVGQYIGPTCVLDVHTGEAVNTWPEAQFANVAFTHDGHWLIIATSREYRFWEVGTWRPGLSVARGLAGLDPGPMALSSGGHLLAILQGTHTIQLLDWRTGVTAATLTPPQPQHLFALAFSPDDRLLAVVGQTAVHLWDLAELRRELDRLKLDWESPPYVTAINRLGDVAFRFQPGESE